MWIALLVFVGRYALQPLWNRRPVWLRGFATEEDELGLRNGRLPPATNNSASASASRQNGRRDIRTADNNTDTDVEAAASNSAVEIAIEEPTEEAVESDTDNVTDSSASSTIVGFGRRHSVVDVRPVSIGGGFASLTIQSWHLMSVTLFLLSVAGVATSLILTFAAGHGYLYLTPVVPCVGPASFLCNISLYSVLT